MCGLISYQSPQHTPGPKFIYPENRNVEKNTILNRRPLFDWLFFTSREQDDKTEVKNLHQVPVLVARILSLISQTWQQKVGAF
jgi:hypothetical protein